MPLFIALTCIDSAGFDNNMTSTDNSSHRSLTDWPGRHKSKLTLGTQPSNLIPVSGEPAPPEPIKGSTEHGLEYLRRLQLFKPSSGMWANLGLKLIHADAASTLVEGELLRDAHGSGRDASTVHRGAVVTVADCAMACAAATITSEGEGTTTVDLTVDFFRTARPGRIAATATVTNRVERLVFCEAIVVQEGVDVARAWGTIALISTEV